ncbi:MAG TPA: hypothetical protein VJR58_03875 [Vineibacter sp.]|nr:hypothetical protein [Vineibacter sp.]
MDAPSSIDPDERDSAAQAGANDLDWITRSATSLAKGMLARGDRPSDIAVFLGVSEARIIEIDRGALHPTAPIAPPSELPPPGPYLHNGTRARFFDMTFSGGTVDIDGNAYQRCIFRRCIIRYQGSGPTHFDDCTFVECSLALVGFAAATADLLRTLHQDNGSWGRRAVNAVLDTIRGRTSTADLTKAQATADGTAVMPQFFDAALARDHEVRATDKRPYARAAGSHRCGHNSDPNCIRDHLKLGCTALP